MWYVELINEDTTTTLMKYSNGHLTSDYCPFYHTQSELPYLSLFLPAQRVDRWSC